MRNRPITAALACAGVWLLCQSSLAQQKDPAMSNNTNPPMMAKNATGTLGRIERTDPALDELLAPDAKIEVLAENIQWCEGPVWYRGGLNFSDVPQNVIYRWEEGKGVSIFLKPSGYTGTVPRGGEPGSNGLTLDNEGRLVMCQHGNRQVARLESDGKSFAPLASAFDGKKFNSPNDLCFDSKGRLYFTDPSYGLEKRDADPKREMDGNYVYLRTTDGKLTRVCQSPIKYADGQSRRVEFPNGVALSPDEKWLYICASDPVRPAVLRYEVLADGTTGAGTMFFDATQRGKEKRPGGPDGLKVDAKGNVWTSGPGGFWIFTPEGKHLGTIVTDTQSANCAWGDDGSTFYMCCNHQLCRIKTKAKGIPSR